MLQLLMPCLNSSSSETTLQRNHEYQPDVIGNIYQIGTTTVYTYLISFKRMYNHTYVVGT
jgi:hypothetical protein